MKEFLIGLCTIIIRALFKVPLSLATPKILTTHFLPLLTVMAKADHRFGVISAAAFNQLLIDKLSGTIHCETRFGNKIVLPSDDNHFLHRALGVYHPESFLRQLKHFISDSQSICESGTHLGELSIWLKQNFPTVRFVGIELHPKFCSFVEKSMEINGYDGFTLVNGFIGPNDIETRGYCDYKSLEKYLPDLNVMAPLGTHYFTSETAHDQSIELPLEKEQKIKKVDFEKIYKIDDALPDFYFFDIEGAEVYGIPAVIELHLKRNKPLPKICFEIHHYAYSGPQARKLKTVLETNKYLMSSADDRHIFCTPGHLKYSVK